MPAPQQDSVACDGHADDWLGPGRDGVNLVTLNSIAPLVRTLGTFSASV
jgi:hypothetical protein